jgi:hypothetical protein
MSPFLSPKASIALAFVAMLVILIVPGRPTAASLAAAALVAGMFIALVSSVAMPRLQTVLATLVLYFGLSYVNTLSEAVFYGLMDWQSVWPGLSDGFVRGTFLGLAAAYLLPQSASRATGRLRTGWQLPAGAVGAVLCYIPLYFIAGMIVFPFVRDFYTGKPIPGLLAILGAQTLRGIVYVAAAAPWLRSMEVSRARAGCLMGVAYAILSGISPLLAGAEMMPFHVRLAHGIEISVSNFIFGCLVAWLLMAPAAKRDATTDAVAASEGQ